MQSFLRHKSEKLFVSGQDTIIFPVKVTPTAQPYAIQVQFIDAECVVLPGCNPVSKDTVIGELVQLPGCAFGAKISWQVTGTREISWCFVEIIP